MKITLLALLATTICLLMMPLTGQAAVLVLDHTAAEDTTLNSGSPDLNSGANTVISSARNAGGLTYRAVMRFDLSSVSFTSIDKMDLTVHGQQFYNGNSALNLYALTSDNYDWAENSACWNYAYSSENWAGGNTGAGTPGTDYETPYLAQQTISGTGYKEYTFSITDQNVISAWLDAGTAEMLFASADEGVNSTLVQIRSSEYSDSDYAYAPTMEITGSSVPEPITFGFLAIGVALLLIQRRKLG